MGANGAKPHKDDTDAPPFDPSTFPSEISLLIFKYLDVKDLGAVARVCKYWRGLSSDNNLWLSLVERQFVSDKSSFITNKIAAYFVFGSEWKNRYHELALEEKRSSKIRYKYSERLRGMAELAKEKLNMFKKKNLKQYKLIMLGLEGEGKTTVLYKIKLGDEPFMSVPTLSFNVETVDSFEGYILEVWDFGGQPECRLMWEPHLAMPGNHAIVWTVDASASKERLREVRKEFQKVFNHENLTKVPFLILANKQDLREAKSARDIVDMLQLWREHDRLWRVQACSAATGKGLEQAFQWLLETLDAVNGRK